ncbi:MAG: hypothetical protein HN341_01690, partial [Verrucomicrobia bacterium]|nr:hypothetical protein [Verrucomicrobiota bacterium]
MTKKAKRIPGMVLVALFSAPFIIGGTVGMIIAVRSVSTLGSWHYILEEFLGSVLSLAIGVGIIAIALWVRREGRAKAARQAAAPDEPWLWENKWANNSIKCSSVAGLVVFGLFTLVWNAISFGVVYSAWDQVVDPANQEALVALVFPGVGILLLAIVALQYIRYRKFGDSHFVMAALPGVIGGKLAGVVRIGRHIEPEDGFVAELLCVKSVTSGSGKNRSTHKHVIHQEELRLDRELLSRDRSQTVVPILFGVPYQSTPSGKISENAAVRWWLKISAKLPGSDYKVRFEVPVFRTSESSSHFKLDTSSLSGYAAEQTPDEVLGEQRILHLRGSHGDNVVWFPMFREYGVGVGVLFGGLLWLAVVAFLLGGKADLVMAVAFGLIGILMVNWALDLLLWTARTTFRDARVRIRYGLLGLH